MKATVRYTQWNLKGRNERSDDPGGRELGSTRTQSRPPNNRLRRIERSKVPYTVLMTVLPGVALERRVVTASREQTMGGFESTQEMAVGGHEMAVVTLLLTFPRTPSERDL